MEGNACYKLSTVKNYLAKTMGKKLELILDIGSNVGDLCLLMHDYFPDATIHGFEAVKEYYEISLSRTHHIPNIHMWNRAVSGEHVFVDDLGRRPRNKTVKLQILKGLPAAGPGWQGGSLVVPQHHASAATPGYELLLQEVISMTLQEIMSVVENKEIDLVKMDCEGCEHSVLGSADVKTLKRIRFIAGEYHGIKRFYQVMKNKLFRTHKVNLIGTSMLGCFFAERLDGQKDGILRFNKTGMLVDRPWLCDIAIDWHIFNEEYVLDEDRYWHAL